MSEFKLLERAILMRISVGLPGEQRQDSSLTGEVKSEHKLGQASGRWVKNLYPIEALAAVKKLDNEARAYHNAVTLPFDAGIGILPAALICEYGDRMRHFKGMRDNLIDSGFLADPQKWVNWAAENHNGTFDPEFYPGCDSVPDGTEINPVTGKEFKHYPVDVDEFRKAMRAKFYFRTEPLPVPDVNHFTQTMHSLLGTDAEGVNERVRDAATEAQRELFKRIISPVKAMAEKLNESPKVRKNGKQAEDIVFRDSLVGNLQEIAQLAPKLNIAGDAAIDSFCKEIDGLTRYSPKTLREDKASRAEVAKKAQDLFKRLSGYNI